MFYMLTIVIKAGAILVNTDTCVVHVTTSIAVYTAFGRILSKVGSRYCSSQVGFHGNSFVFFSSGQSKRLGLKPSIHYIYSGLGVEEVFLFFKTSSKQIIQETYSKLWHQLPYYSKQAPIPEQAPTPYFRCFCGLGSSPCNPPPCNLWYCVILCIRARAALTTVFVSRLCGS